MTLHLLVQQLFFRFVIEGLCYNIFLLHLPQQFHQETYCNKFLDEIVVVDEGEICYNIVLLSQNEKIIAEPAGAMSSAALRKYKNKIKNKNIMCLICGGNNDPKRLPEIEKRSQDWLERLKK